RDAGFSVFYMGISVGAVLGSLLVPLCAARFGWRSGFALPVIGMLFGLAQFILTRRWLGGSGLAPARRRGAGPAPRPELAHEGRPGLLPGVRSWLPVIIFVSVVAI